MKPPYWLRIRTVTGQATVAQVSIRWWHPGAWLALMRVYLRAWQLLPPLCERCGGAGRIGRIGIQSRRLKKRACIHCGGTGLGRRAA